MGACFLKRPIGPEVDAGKALAAHGLVCTCNLPKDNRLRVGFDHFFTILHHNFALQYAKIIFKNYSGPFLTWRIKCDSFFGSQNAQTKLRSYPIDYRRRRTHVILQEKNALWYFCKNSAW